jgi:hypothetical protein
MSTVLTGRRTDNDVTPILLSIRERLAIHPHFRGRASLLSIELVAETIVLSGRLPSYYLKQLLVEAIRAVPGVVDIEDHVNVLSPTVSSFGDGVAGRQKLFDDRSHTKGSPNRSGAQTTNEREVR